MKVLVPALLAATAASQSAQVGTVAEKTRIFPGSAGFVGPLDDDEYFGNELANLGDVNGDGVPDLAVGVPYDSEGAQFAGAVWVLFLASDGTVVGEQKISALQGGFGGTLGADDELGERLANVGDLDGDGRAELAALAGAPNRLYVLFLNADGTVRATRETLFTDPAFQPPTQPARFGGDVLGLGDLDGDGLGDLALGAPGELDGALGAGAVWIARLAADGSVAATQKISATSGGFTGSLPEQSFFGKELVHMADLDGNGQRELAVLAPGHQFGGTEFVLFLDANEQVLTHAEYDMVEYGLRWPRPDGSLTVGMISPFQTWLGDLDGDGFGELASGFYFSFPGNSLSGFQIGSILADGSQTWRVKVGENRGGLGDLARGMYLGAAFAPLGDLDGDGTPELAVGAPEMRANGARPGAVWILSLQSSSVRNGSGTNPVVLAQVQKPTFGQSWDLVLDGTGHAAGAALVYGYSEKSAGVPTPLGEVLIGGTRFFRLSGVHAGGPVTLSTSVPPASFALLDLPLHLQGLVGGAPGARLSNALDVIVGD
jgi:hypothetical protein